MPRAAGDKKEPESTAPEEKAPDKKAVRKGRPPKADKAEKEPKPEKPPKAEKAPKAAAKKAAEKEEATPPAPEQPPEPREAPRKDEQEQIVYLNLSELHAFQDHPFQVKQDEEMTAMKICNLASLDPMYTQSGRKGLSKCTILDKSVFDEFQHNWAMLSAQAEDLLGFHIFEIGNAENLHVTRQRKKHFSEISYKAARKFFRKAVLASYNYKCCISGVTIPNLLIASHIKPWEVSDEKTERANPANGLCLNAFYDKAFDQGLITVDPRMRIWVSPKVKTLYSDPFSEKWLYELQGETIISPQRFRPQKDFLEYHNDIVFRG